jgi:hypothetical protein
MAYNPYYNGNPYFQQQPYYNAGAMPDMLNQQKMQYQNPMQPQPTPQPTPTNDMIWVLGEVEAQSYPVAPNNTVTLWDKNQKTFYVKTANAQGIPSIQTYDFSERTQNAPQTPTEHTCKCGDKFIPKSELTEIQGKFDDIFNRLQALEDKAKTKATKTAKGDAE